MSNSTLKNANSKRKILACSSQLISASSFIPAILDYKFKIDPGFKGCKHVSLEEQNQALLLESL
jgi:hypothetical protein